MITGAALSNVLLLPFLPIIHGPVQVQRGFEKGIVFLANLKSPIVADIGSANSRLMDHDRQSIDLVLKAMRTGRSRSQASGDAWTSESPERVLSFTANCIRGERLTLVGGGGSLPPNRHRGRRLAVTECFETYEDLVEQETIVAVAVSGGGARAAEMAASTMALLEERFEDLRAFLRPDATSVDMSMFERIDLYSVVSGGAIFGQQIAKMHRDFASAEWWDLSIPLPIPVGGLLGEHPFAYDDVFWEVANIDVLRRERTQLGLAGSLAWISPYNAGLPILATVLTNFSYTDWMAFAVDPATILPYQLAYGDERLGQLPPRPRIYFNTTALDTGVPFVITRNVTQLPTPGSSYRTARVDRVQSGCKKQDLTYRPLCQSSSLEDIASSPGQFPLAAAIMASAAFPVGFKPIELHRYQWDPVEERIYSSSDRIQLSDGGVFDNSGLTTALDVFEAIQAIANDDPGKRADGEKKRLILISINADHPVGEAYLHEKQIKEDSILTNLAEIRFPIDSAPEAISSLDLIHNTNKWRSEVVAGERIAELRREGHEVYYFPINLSQFSAAEKIGLNGDSDLVERLKKIPTDFIIGANEVRTIREAVEHILSARQRIPSGSRAINVVNPRVKDEAGWTIPHKKSGASADEIDCIGSALAVALLRAATNNWTEALFAEPARVKKILACEPGV